MTFNKSIGYISDDLFSFRFPSKWTEIYQGVTLWQLNTYYKESIHFWFVKLFSRVQNSTPFDWSGEVVRENLKINLWYRFPGNESVPREKLVEKLTYHRGLKQTIAETGLTKCSNLEVPLPSLPVNSFVAHSTYLPLSLLRTYFFERVLNSLWHMRLNHTPLIRKTK